MVEPMLPALDSHSSGLSADYEDPYVVVEVLDVPVEQPPPLAPITQPIQVNQRVGILPEARSEVKESSTSLPRLDFSLAAQEGSSLSSIFFSDEGNQSGRLVVKLPQPGAETHQFNPNDFIVPAASTDVVETDKESPLPIFDDRHEDMEGELPPIPLEEIELPAFEETLSDFSDSGIRLSGLEMLPASNGEPEPEPIDWSEMGLNPAGQPAPGATDLPWSGHQANAGSEETGHRTLSTEWQSMETQPIPTLGASKAKQSGEDGGFHPSEFEDGSLHQGSVGNLFSVKPDTGEIPAGNQVLDAPVRRSELRDLKDEGDVLDELFGSPPGTPKGLSKTAVVMLCGIGGAAIIATVVVIFLINLMGGLDPQLAYAEETDASAAEAPADQPVASVALEEPSIDGAPLVIDPVAMLRNDSSEARAAVAPAGLESSEAAPPRAEGGQETIPEPAAISLDERVERIVNGTDPLAAGTPATEAPVSNPPSNPASNPVDSAIESFKGASGGVSPASPARSADTVGAATASNYNPPAAFPAPGEGDSPLRNTNDLIDAFLRAPDWEARLKYTYQGESLRPAIGDYYGKWADKKIDRFSLQLFQMEKNTALGGPYWVYLVSTSDQDQGFPLIIRVEDGNLKVDWEIYSEFFDRHFVRFRDGKMPRPATFRVVVERVSDYYGSDREGFKDLGSYNVYQINPPYGELNEFSEYAFVKKDTELAKQLDAVVGLNDEPLAVIITLDEKPFAHGVKHYLITEYVTEGWFR